MGWLTDGVVVIAAVDVPLQRFLHRSRLRMSHQEFKAGAQGSPRAIRRCAASCASASATGQPQQRQRGHPRSRLRGHGPTHYAVAIHYDDGGMRAPPGNLAPGPICWLTWRIRDITRPRHPGDQSPVLARALYAHAELNQDICDRAPRGNEVLYVYRLKAALRRRRPDAGRGAAASGPA